MRKPCGNYGGRLWLQRICNEAATHNTTKTKTVVNYVMKALIVNLIVPKLKSQHSV